MSILSTILFGVSLSRSEFVSGQEFAIPITYVHLVIESSLSSFNSTCVPGSLMRRYFEPLGTVSRTGARLNIGDLSDSVNDITLWHGPSVIGFLSYNYFVAIVDYLVRFGADRTSRNDRLSNCTREMIDLVPPIELSEGNFGTIKIFSDEYIELLPGGICRIAPHISSPGYRPNHFAVNLLKLQNLNIRISRNRIIEFCDANYDDPFTSG